MASTDDQTTVEINITGTNDAPTITGGPVSKNNLKALADQTGVQLTDSGTFDVEDLDTSNIVNAKVTFLTFDDNGTNGTDPALNGVDFHFFFHVSLDPVIDDGH